MPAKIDPRDTFDTNENEILFTRSALRADEDARDLLAQTDSWMPLLQEARDKDRVFRTADMDADASRSVANSRLDGACVLFGRDLLHAVGDRKAPRFVGFFPSAPSRWVAQPFDKQIVGVRGWLATSGEVVLEQHRENLTRRLDTATAAQTAVAAVAPARGLNWQMRRDFADPFTRQRDGLHRDLAERAAEKNLPRDWPDAFFRVESREPSAPSTPPTPT